MLKRISSKQPQLRSSGPRNGFNGSHYMQVTRSRHRVYTWIIFSTIFPSLNLISQFRYSFSFRAKPREFFHQWNCNKYFAETIPRLAPSSPCCCKEGNEDGGQRGRKKGWKVEIVTWSRSGRDDRKRISFASQTFSAKVSSIFARLENLVCQVSARCVA